MSGAFIVVEGPDGAGKSSQSKVLAEWLDAEWRCFPDRRTPIGQLIDQHLKGEWSAGRKGAVLDLVPDHGLDALNFQALQLANRVEVQRSIVATMATGRHVVCDRYWGSGYAYGAADGLDPTYVFDIQRGLLHPVVSILLDVPIEVAVERLKARGAPAERYEGNVAHMEEVARRYRQLWALAPQGTGAWVAIDATGSVDEVQQRMRDVVAKVLAETAAQRMDAIESGAELLKLRVQLASVGQALEDLNEAVRKAPHAANCDRSPGRECTCPRSNLVRRLEQAKAGSLAAAGSGLAMVKHGQECTSLLREVFRREELNGGAWLGRDLFEQIRKHVGGES